MIHYFNSRIAVLKILNVLIAHLKIQIGCAGDVENHCFSFFDYARFTLFMK